jgi:transglutaminase/protease-like cytokinesis protein 3
MRIVLRRSLPVLLAFVVLLPSSGCFAATPAASRRDALPTGEAVQLDPIVLAMPPSEETSIEAVATYRSAREPTPEALLRAFHDWVATRVRYDETDAALPAPVRPCHYCLWAHSVGLSPGERRAEEIQVRAEWTFERRRGVCANFAALVARLGWEAGLDVAYVSGTTDTGARHAWNIARVRGRTYFLDATWDRQPFRTTFLTTDARAFERTHKAEYQLW